MLAQNLFFKQPALTDRRAMIDVGAMHKMGGLGAIGAPMVGMPTVRRRPPMRVGMPPMESMPPMIGMPPSSGRPITDMRARFPTDMEAKPVRTKEFTPQDMMRQQLMESEYAMKRPYKPTNEHNNQAVRPFVGHPKFGFQTILNQNTFGQLPTAPPVVGGNTNWVNAKVTPATQYLHSVLAGARPMNPPPALGSTLRLTEPTMHSIHTTY